LLIFNYQSLLIVIISLVSCFVSVYFQLKIYADFLIIGIIIVFPLTFTMREAFRRRERSLQYLSMLKACIQSVYFHMQNCKLETYKKTEFGNISHHITDTLMAYLSGTSKDVVAVQKASYAIVTFINQNRKATNKTSVKVFLFMSKINESIEFLLAVRRHKTPWGPRVIVLFAIYAFAIFYPPAVLYKTGFDFQVWNLFLATIFKVLILISLYNVQVLMEDPFSADNPDGIRLDDFRFTVDLMSSTPIKPVVQEPHINTMF